MPGLLRHILACNDAVLPGGRLALLIGGEAVGWVRPALAAAMADMPGVVAAADAVAVVDGEGFHAIGRELAAAGWCRWRGEAFDVRAADGRVLGQVDRGGLPAFGLLAEGVHLNGIVERADGPHLWVGRRAADKALDPGKLDHLVAGGVSAGMTAWQTLIKEAAEEAAIPAALAGQAVLVGCVEYANERPEGLRRDRLHCYDLVVPGDFRPVPADGEVEDFSLWPAADVLAAVRDGDDFKFNVNVVLIDFFLRRKLVAGAEARELRAALEG